MREMSHICAKVAVVPEDNITDDREGSRFAAGWGSDTTASHTAIGKLLRPGWFPLTVTLVYALVGAVWILISDQLLLELAPSVEVFQELQTYKGWLYIGVTAVLLFAALAGAQRHIQAEQRAREESLDRLDLAFRAADGGIWDRNLLTDELYVSDHVKRLLGLDPDDTLTLDDWRVRIHPEDRKIVRTRMRELFCGSAKEMGVCYRVRAEDGTYCWFQALGRRIDDERGRPVRTTGVLMDITALRDAEANIQRLIHYDSLTGLPNRRMVERELTRIIESAGDGHDAVLFVLCDIDRFMDINQEFGAEGGDGVLAQLAGRLHDFAGGNGLAGRLGGDEFALILPAPVQRAADLRWILDRLQYRIQEPLTLEDVAVSVNASLGVALCPGDGATAAEMMTNAGLALHEAQKAGGAQSCFYSSELNQDVQMRRNLARDLRSALQTEAITPAYQPILRLHDGRVRGFEALARWHHPDHGTVSPATFGPLAEELGIVDQLGRLMLRRSCEQAQRWITETGEPLMMAVNLSAVELQQKGLAEDIAAVLAETGLPPDCLEMEVTESAVMHDVELAAQTLGRLRDLGISIAIDDFGTGYSSLVGLHRLPVSRLKIDRTFVQGCGNNPESTAIVEAIIGLAQTLNLHTTAEGVETEAQRALLAEYGCDRAQGFLFSPAIPPDEARRLLLAQPFLYGPDAPAKRAQPGRQ